MKDRINQKGGNKVKLEGIKMLVKVKSKLKKGKLTAKVKYPLVGKAELELGSTSKLKAKIKAPFLFSAKLFGFFKLKKGAKNEKEKR